MSSVRRKVFCDRKIFGRLQQQAAAAWQQKRSCGTPASIHLIDSTLFTELYPRTSRPLSAANYHAPGGTKRRPNIDSGYKMEYDFLLSMRRSAVGQNELVG
jgi:hypothetical protein